MEPTYPLPPIRLLQVERTGYQSYKAAIDAHAEVRWTGISGVLAEGRRIWALPPAKLEALRQCLEKYDFLNLDEAEKPYIRAITDPDPGTLAITAIFSDGSRKEILHDLNDYPVQEKLWQLGRRVETILGIRKYAGKPPLLE